MPSRSLATRVAALEKTVEKLSHVKASAADKRELKVLTKAVALARRALLNPAPLNPAPLNPAPLNPAAQTARSHARARRTLRR